MAMLGAIAVLLAPLTPFWWIILLIGAAVPVALMVGRARSARDHRSGEEIRAREVLGVIAEHGSLTGAEAARAIGIDPGEASMLLDRLARQGRLARQAPDGIAVYTLPGDASPHAMVRASMLPSGKPGDPKALERGASPVAPDGSGDVLSPEASSTPEAASTGEPAVAPARDIPAASHDAIARPAEPLSEREREVLAVLASGRTTAEAARDLYISVGTVKSHTANIYRKLGAKNRAEAVSRARDLGLLS